MRIAVCTVKEVTECLLTVQVHRLGVTDKILFVVHIYRNATQRIFIVV
jgi:hypothetical protein